MINIAIACKRGDDREAIVALLRKQDDFHIACIVEDGFDVIISVLPKQPDVIIMDFSLGDVESPVLAPVIKRKSPSTEIIVLFPQDNRTSVEESLKAGISGYLIRQNGYDELTASIRSVYHGGLYITGRIRDEILDSIAAAVAAASRETKRGALPEFTATELGIFSGITSGCTDTEIAASLNISRGTVRNYIGSVKKKTGLRNRSQVIIFALLNGIISWEKFNGGKSLDNPEIPA